MVEQKGAVRVLRKRYISVSGAMQNARYIIVTSGVKPLVWVNNQGVCCASTSRIKSARANYYVDQEIAIRDPNS